MKRDKFQIYPRDDGTFGWRFKSKNGRVMDIPGEGFKTKGSARRSIVTSVDRMQMALKSPDGIEFVKGDS